MPRIRIIVLLLVLAVAAALGFWATLPANNGQISSSRTTQTTQPLPPARSVVKDVPRELIPSYQAGAAECPGCHGPSMPPWASTPVIMAAT